MRTTTVSGQTEDSGFCGNTTIKRYLWNYYNQRHRPLCHSETTASWNYSTATVREANGTTSVNRADIVVGIAEATLDLSLKVKVFNSTNAGLASAGIGEDSTTTYTGGCGDDYHNLTGNIQSDHLTCRVSKMPAIGRHFYSWNEWGGGTATTTFYSAVAAAGSTITGGLFGWIEG